MNVVNVEGDIVEMITVDTWRIWPELRLAQNTHNGTFVELDPCGDNDWKLSCNSCPAQWMLRELAEWWSQNLPTDRKIINDEERYHNTRCEYLIIRSIV